MNDYIEPNAQEKKKHKKLKKLLIALLAIIIILFLAGLIAIPAFIMPMFLGQRYEQEQYDSLDYRIDSERIMLTTEDGIPLAAWRTRAEDAKGTVIILSGIQNPSVTAFFGYARMLSDNGWDALLIEMRARGESGGDEIGFGMTEWRDVKAGVDFLSADETVSELPIVTMGTSMGGGTVLIAAGEMEEVDGVISISGFSSWTDLFVDNMSMFGMPKLIGILDIPFVNAYLGFHFGFDALKYSPLNGLEKIGERPILMMHSTEDSQVPYREFEKLKKKADKLGLNVTTFIREGDEHFICYDKYVQDPTQDVEFSQALLSFLENNF